MAKMNKIMPPRNTTIRGQDHLLAYITPEEAQLLMDNGGAGKPGPMGIPAFYGFGEHDDASSPGQASAGSAQAGDTDTSDAETDDPATAGAGSTEAGYSDVTGQMGTPGADLAGYKGSVGQDFGGYIGSYDYGQKVAALEQLNKDLYDLSRRQERAKSLPGKLGLLAGKNINNIAAALVGYPPDLLSSINPFSDNKIGSGLDPDTLAGLQSTGIRGPSGQITGVTDEFGDVAYGYDPNENYDGGDGPEPEVKPVNPETGQCDEGYMFDEDMQACRLAPVAMAERQAAGQPGDAYARMGLLDQVPTGLPQFQQRYGAGFGSPADFAAANMDFRRRGAYRPEFFKNPYPTTGYTLLS
jgi:hypothetical protein